MSFISSNYECYPETAAKVERCKRDWEMEIKCVQKRIKGNEEFLDAILKFVGYDDNPGDQLIGMVGELTLRIRKLNQQITEMIERQAEEQAA